MRSTSFTPSDSTWSRRRLEVSRSSPIETFTGRLQDLRGLLLELSDLRVELWDSTLGDPVSKKIRKGKHRASTTAAHGGYALAAKLETGNLPSSPSTGQSLGRVSRQQFLARHLGRPSEVQSPFPRATTR